MCGYYLAMYRVAEHSGTSNLAELTALLQRARLEHPTKGLWEAADHQWWWRATRSTAHQPMPFWYDDHGPVAAAVTTEWASTTWLDLITLPSVSASLIREVFERGQTLTADLAAVEMLVDDQDDELRVLLADNGFHQGSGDVTAWLGAPAAPEVSTLADGYSLHTRASSPSGVHHFAQPIGPEVENRLRQTSLYRPDLDLFVVDDHGETAAYGLFWNDPNTGVGLVEPIGTEQTHRGRGLARHVVTTGIHKLVAAGSERIKVSYDGDNAPAVALYLGAGFEPTMTCSMWSTATT
jgi:ribosomal protein S18 acetylase RimI-like enzyme